MVLLDIRIIFKVKYIEDRYWEYFEISCSWRSFIWSCWTLTYVFFNTTNHIDLSDDAKFMKDITYEFRNLEWIEVETAHYVLTEPLYKLFPYWSKCCRKIDVRSNISSNFRKDSEFVFSYGFASWRKLRLEKLHNMVLLVLQIICFHDKNSIRRSFEVKYIEGRKCEFRKDF